MGATRQRTRFLAESNDKNERTGLSASAYAGRPILEKGMRGLHEAVARSRQMINKDYFREIGLEKYASEYVDDDLIERTVTVRLPKRVFEKIQAAMIWRSLPLEHHAERELFRLTISQVKNLSMLTATRMEAHRALKGKV
jgi:hypothetical protein